MTNDPRGEPGADEAAAARVVAHAVLGSIGSLRMLLDLLDEEVEPLTRHSLIAQGKQHVAFATALLLDSMADAPAEARTALDTLADGRAGEPGAGNDAVR